MRLNAGAATSVGKVRPINEDAYLSSPERGLFVVCDGMGGAAAGEVASRLAVETISERAVESAIRPDANGGFQPRTALLGRAIEDANDVILEHAGNDAAHAGMGTTVVGVWLAGQVMSIAHVGDSRCYVRSKSGFEGVTSDHSLVEAQVQAGLIDREQSLRSEHQNILLRALGRDADVLVELRERPLAAGDRVLLCTDGLTRTITDRELADALGGFAGDPQGACDHLIAMANNNGGPDNITAVIIDVQGPVPGQIFGRP